MSVDDRPTDSIRSSDAFESPSGSGRNNNVQSVSRALKIFEVIAAHGGCTTLSVIAEEARLPAATAHRILRTMAEDAFIVQRPNRSYSLGRKLAPIGEAARHIA